MVLNAALGTAIEELMKAVLETKDKAFKRYRPVLDRLEETLKSIEPLLREIEELNRILDRPAEEETERLIQFMMSARQLVLERSKDQWWWTCCWQAYFEEELKLLDEKISNFIRLDLAVLKAMNLLQTRQDLRKSRKAVVSAEFRDAFQKFSIWELSGVCSPPKPPPFIVCFDALLNELKLKLLQDQVSVSLLTVTGLGGSGKTTLAKMVCWDDQVKGKFKKNIFFVTFGKTPKLKTIVQKLYQHNGHPEPKFQSDEDAVNQLENLLKEIGKSPILLILDDVWPESESLVEKLKFQIPNYKILMTSRSAFRRFDALYVLKPLPEADAKYLFRHSASLNDSNSNIPDDVVEKIVKGCGGSPLALTVTGRSLCHQHLIVWTNRARDLSTGHSILDSDSEVLARLQKSLEVLDTKATECFYDLGLFPEDQRIPAAALVDMWAELYNEDDAHAMEKIHKLVDLNTVDVVTRKFTSDKVEYNYHYVTQYDLLRELAILQTSQEPEDKRNRLIIDISRNNLPTWWTVEEEYHIAARLLSISTDEAFTSEWCNLQPPEVEVLVLNLRQKKYTLPTFINKMNRLKVLIITNYEFYPAELENFELLDHLSHLKRIRLEKVSIPSLNKTGVQLKNLHKFSLFMCNVNEAFKNCCMPNLVEMNIDYCNMVELPVVLSYIVSLKKLSITNCHKLSALPEGIEKLVNLESLRVSSCTGLVELPESITNLHSLKYLDISDSVNISKLPENMGKLGNLEKLNVRGCSKLSELPYSITDLRSLRDVVCDAEMATLWEPYTTILSDLRLNLGFLYLLPL